MYKAINRFTKSSIDYNEFREGESIEEKVKRMTQNNEPISDSAELIYVERNKGVEPSYDIRTDKWDAAIDAMEKVSESKRNARLKRLEDKKQRSDDGLTPSPQGGDTAENQA